ncbi:MAG: hypothetical protein WCW44_06260 [archaeon]
MNKKLIFTIALLLIFFGVFVNASYILQLKYENGIITQEAVYPSAAIATPNFEGALDLTLGNYSTTIGLPMLEAIDGPSGKVGIRENTSPEIFVVVSEVPVGTTLTIKDISGNTLLSEPLKEVTNITPNTPAKDTSTDGTGIVLGGILLIIILIILGLIGLGVVGVIVFFLFIKKK